MGKLPITLLMRNGTLKLENGRLAFATKKKVLFDHPVEELHSVGPVSRVGMRIKHGDRRYTLVPCYEAVHATNTSNDLVDVVLGASKLSRARRADQRMRDAREHWIELLRPMVGEPPLCDAP
jgi:hypothetical protein